VRTLKTWLLYQNISDVIMASQLLNDDMPLMNSRVRDCAALNGKDLSGCIMFEKKFSILLMQLLMIGALVGNLMTLLTSLRFCYWSKFLRKIKYTWLRLPDDPDRNIKERLFAVICPHRACLQYHKW